MLRSIATIFFLFFTHFLYGQPGGSWADQLRKASKIPALAYAVLSADSVYEMQVLGVVKANTTLQATSESRFRIGSNTKAVTGLLAAILVKQGKLSWQTRFFDLFPEMKAGSRKEYHHYTLLDLLSFRTRLIRYTYTDPLPVKGQFSGDEQRQRYQFVQWVMQQAPVQGNNEISFSNPGYVAAGLMLEKASGKDYKQLVQELGQLLQCDFEFGQPNAKDRLETWGHNASLVAEAPSDNYKLNWLLPAGNINMSLPGYARFVQVQLKGLQGRSALLEQQDFSFLHYGLPGFAVGWFWQEDEKGRTFSWSIGNPGTFLARVYVFSNENRAFIILANAQTNEADEGMNRIYEELKRRYMD